MNKMRNVTAWRKMKFKGLTCLTTLVVILTIHVTLLLTIRSYEVHDRSNDDHYAMCTNVTREDKDFLINDADKLQENDTFDVDLNHDAIVDELIKQLQSEADFFPDYFSSVSVNQLTRRLGWKAVNVSRKLSAFAYSNMSLPAPAWKLMYNNIRQHSLYDPDDPNVATLMHNMATLRIIQLDIMNGGTQLNLQAILEDGTKAIVKPMRLPRDVEELPNVYYFDFMERHTSEIAAFQLDKLLGFYKVPPTIGRKVHIRTEMMPVAQHNFTRTIYRSEVNNVCFFGKCLRWCDVSHPYCGSPEVIEVSVMVFMPFPHRQIPVPWKRSYNYLQKADWETNDNYCEKVRMMPRYRTGVNLHEAIDCYIFDYITGNEDRHTFYYFDQFFYDTYPILTDNGKGFGRHSADADSNLKPLVQCCKVRKSTVLKFLKLYMGPEKLSSLMEEALSTDPVAPVLTENHLKALDRRVTKVLKEIAKCVEKRGVKSVIVSDEFK